MYKDVFKRLASSLYGSPFGREDPKKSDYRDKVLFQGFVNGCARAFEDGLFYALRYKINGKDFTPDVPPEHEEDAKRIAGKLERYNKLGNDIKQYRKKFGRKSIRSLNPLRYIKGALIGLDNAIVGRYCSYYDFSGIIGLSPFATRSTVAEELIHAKDAFDSGYYDRASELLEQYLELETEKHQSRDKRGKEEIERKQKGIDFKLRMSSILIEGHKEKTLYNITRIVPYPPKPSLNQMLKAAVGIGFDAYVCLPTHFLDRTTNCHAEAGAFFKQILSLDAANKIIQNPPENKEEWKSLNKYFDRIKDILGTYNYEILVKNSASIRAEIDKKRRSSDLTTAMTGIIYYLSPLIFILLSKLVSVG